ncbi:uncharacterized protein LOC121055977 [Oryza brachyantha]|uniref:Acidic protein n=1 Tax=Oryza brachyantha TaxID=4533 RepID=J3NCK8_ORYBR|nr:uncharacterized protein LOC121055977 [Oryza brachyantha]
MEQRKRAAAAVALCCMLILLPAVELQQVGAMSKFCRCYTRCYPDCRWSLPRFICVLKCMDDCSPSNKNVATGGDCHSFCLLTICGMAMNGAADAASCVDDCTKNPNLYTKFL